MKKVAILGSGNIGCDLLVKCLNEKDIQIVCFSGRHANSKGLLFAKTLGVNTSDRSIEGIIFGDQKPEIIIDIFIDKKTVVLPYVKSVLQPDGSFKSGSLINLEPSHDSS